MNAGTVWILLLAIGAALFLSRNRISGAGNGATNAAPKPPRKQVPADKLAPEGPIVRGPKGTLTLSLARYRQIRAFVLQPGGAANKKDVAWLREQGDLLGEPEVPPICVARDWRTGRCLETA